MNGPSEPRGSCPYCRFPLKSGAQATSCPACRAVHHAECWTDGGGCAIVGCEQRPAPSTQAAEYAAPTVPATVPTAAPLPPPVAASRPGRPGMVIVAIVVLALVIAASAAAVILTRGDGDEVLAQAATATVTTVTEATTADEPVTTAQARATSADDAPKPSSTGESDASRSRSESRSGVLPDVSEPEMADAITDVIRTHHELLIDGSYRAAFDLLSTRKQRQLERETGFSGWQANQADLRNHLTGLDRLTARIESLDRRHGVATVSITGPELHLPNNRCGSRYEGITWATFEDGAWRYEPGYSTTPQRRAQWGSGAARDRTLAWTCWQG